MRTIIYLVRHGEVHNPKQIMYERLPGYHLSDTGKKQAQALGKHLSDKKISAIYASPLERTQETAKIIASYHSISVFHDGRLIEVSTSARGKNIKELEKDHWNFYSSKYESEKLSDIWKRMRESIRDAIQNHKGQEIVLVSHGDPLMIAMIKHKGKPLRLSHIRGQEYVQTAGGFRLVFEDFKAVEVDSLQISVLP